jgi:hypothetical protein
MAKHATPMPWIAAEASIACRIRWRTANTGAAMKRRSMAMLSFWRWRVDHGAKAGGISGAGDDDRSVPQII